MIILKMVHIYININDQIILMFFSNNSVFTFTETQFTKKIFNEMQQIFIVQNEARSSKKGEREREKRKIIIPSRLFLINFQPSCPGFPSLTRKKKPFPLLYKFSTPFQLDLLYSLYLRATFSPPVCKERKSLSSVSSLPSYLSTFYFLIFFFFFFFFIPITQSEFQRCYRVRMQR